MSTHNSNTFLNRINSYNIIHRKLSQNISTDECLEQSNRLTNVKSSSIYCCLYILASIASFPSILFFSFVIILFFIYNIIYI